MLAMEHTNKDFYITEKIFFAFRGGAIPIYWGGGSETSKIFHPGGYIPVTDPHGPLTEVTDRILEIEADPGLYNRTVQIPILLDGERTLQKYFPVVDTPEDTPWDIHQNLKHHILHVLSTKLRNDSHKQGPTIAIN